MAAYKLKKRCEAVFSRLVAYVPGTTPAVLDVGACDGKMLAYIKERLPGAVCEGVEPDERFLSLASWPGVSVRKGRAESLDLPDGSFDFAVMSSVLEHVEDPAAGLAEVRRVLRPGGALCLITVMPLYEKLTVLSGMKKNDHFQNYRLPELCGEISAAGFRVAEAGAMPFPLFYNLAVAVK